MPNTDPLILALDTATQFCSVALARGSQSVLEDEGTGSGHSEKVLLMVDSVLKKAGEDLGGLDAVAFGAGPGAFTGLRVACGVAQGLAWAREKPVVAVGNLQALAFRVLEREVPGTRVLAAIDARMHQAYAAVYEKGGDGQAPKELEPPALFNPEELAPLAGRLGAGLAAGSALAAFPDALRGAGLRLLQDEPRATALDIARLARILFLEGRAVLAEQAAPLYVRNRVALTIEQRAAGEKL